MILVYEFGYISNNGVLENFLQVFALNHGAEYYISKEADKVFLHIRDSEENLVAFSDSLSKALPFSLFLKSTAVFVSEKWEPEKAAQIAPCEIYLPFTPKALQKAKEDFDPFVQNEIGKNLAVKPPLVFEPCDKIATNKEAFAKAAELIAQGKKLSTKTLSGTFIISIEPKNSNFIVMPTDLSVAGKIAVLSDEEIAVLASLEKPIIRTHTNLIFSAKYPKFPRFVNLRLASDLFLYLLSLELYALGVEFVVLEKEGDADASLHFEQDISTVEPLYVCVLKNAQNIIVKGKTFVSPQLLASVKTFKNAYHTQFTAQMQELGLFKAANFGVYLSFHNNDMLMFYSQKTGVLDLLSVDFEDSLSELLVSIESEDETGAKLIRKYKNANPEINLNIPFEVKNIATLWAAAAYLLGFGSNLREAIEKLLEYIEIFGGQKGPRVDYKLLNKNSAKTALDAHKFIRSVISFRLAGTDDEILSYGICESLVFFISDFVDKTGENFEFQNILLSGSLFASPAVSSLCIRHLSVSHKVYFNKELPIEL